MEALFDLDVRISQSSSEDDIANLFLLWIAASDNVLLAKTEAEDCRGVHKFVLQWQVWRWGRESEKGFEVMAEGSCHADDEAGGRRGALR